jgi:hypothetical protein
MIERTGSSHSDPVGTEVNSLAAIIRAHPYVQTMIDEGDMARVRTAAPMFGSGLDRVLGRIGHRGPSELELSSKVFADRPELVVNAARRAMGASLPAAEQSVHPTEVAHDITVAYTHQLRLAVRELARRRVAAERLASVDDIYYLTIDEALTMPDDAELRIKLRSAEADRATGSAVLSIGSELRGAAFHSGVGEGTTRVVDSIDDLPIRAGEIGVIAAADAGLVALMGTPEAVIFDGDLLEGAFPNLPTLLLRHAKDRLTTGMRVRVDGAAGSVTVLAEESLGELTVAR